MVEMVVIVGVVTVIIVFGCTHLPERNSTARSVKQDARLVDSFRFVIHSISSYYAVAYRKRAPRNLPLFLHRVRNIEHSTRIFLYESEQHISQSSSDATISGCSSPSHRGIDSTPLR